MSNRRFKSEGPILYNRYQFGYCEWLEWLAGDSLEEAYEGGFLPFSADLTDPRHLFYMARSLRVDVRQLALSKKRRYEHRGWKSHNLLRECLTKEQFLAEHGRNALETALVWMERRFGKPYLSRERLDYIFRKPFLKDVLTWTRDSRLQAFALIVRENWGAHYWYAFYENTPETEAPSGQGYLIDFLDWTRENELPHAYLGTCYGKKSLYKSRGIEGVEFWDGNTWSADKDKLLLFQEADELADGPA